MPSQKFDERGAGAAPSDVAWLFVSDVELRCEGLKMDTWSQMSRIMSFRAFVLYFLRCMTNQANNI